MADQLHEQREISSYQQLKLAQQEIETMKLQNIVNELEAKSRSVEQQTSTAGWLRSLISLI